MYPTWSWELRVDIYGLQWVMISHAFISFIVCHWSISLAPMAVTGKDRCGIGVKTPWAVLKRWMDLKYGSQSLRLPTLLSFFLDYCGCDAADDISKYQNEYHLTPLDTGTCCGDYKCIILTLILRNSNTGTFSKATHRWISVNFTN